MEKRKMDAVAGCLLGGAVGDALGAGIEFMSWPEISAKFGPDGITGFVPAYGGLGKITDDTQMMLFTAEGLLRAWVRASARGICDPPSVIHHAYLRWLLTQGHSPDKRLSVSKNGWLIKNKALWSQRAPGLTCLGALESAEHFGFKAENSSKGCGTVMRSAPFAFFEESFAHSLKAAMLTHGHRTGYVAAAAFSLLLQLIWAEDMSLDQSLDRVMERLQALAQQDGKECEVLSALQAVRSFRKRGIAPTPLRIDEYGGGWIAEEALAIGVWCALFAQDYEQGVLTSVNHSGDSDSTGMVAGNILGLIHGRAAIPERWLATLELKEVIEQIAEDIILVPETYDGGYGPMDDEIFEKYPGG
ncbi:ADP-ribosylglycohydrolase [Oceanisphaera litoralis]|uniref:ADP-ribosylglycohydrolase family protein n=1 Tax=Oceanisphaera litoralis TaxID=225144 RepID=UPI001958F578|nr:ADP-ribosylglycohydrolase family protein [Oceanisphaera litoralis]MBM7454894.1 ADP-ribosylglycohydrolase [Oceanisphaera litoralis]